MNSIVERARSLKDVPFVHQGRDENGIDCVGLLAYAIQYPFSDVPPYSSDPVNCELETAMTAAFGAPTFIKPTAVELREGDIVALQYKGPIRHVGIVAAHLTLPGVLSLVHTDSSVERVTEHILDSKWLRRIELVWRLERP